MASRKNHTLKLAGILLALVLVTSCFVGETVYQAVDVIAEAIQAKPASAAGEAWKVTVSSDGRLSIS